MRQLDEEMLRLRSSASGGLAHEDVDIDGMPLVALLD